MQSTKEYAYKVFNLLKSHYPQAKMILNWGNNWELLVSIILSAQCTDKKVNEVTARVFPKYRKMQKDIGKTYDQYYSVIARRDDEAISEDRHASLAMTKEEIIEIINFAIIPIEKLENDIRSTGFYHNKAKNIKAAAKVVLEKYRGSLPKTIKELVTIPGVGRKTANVFLGNAYKIYEGIAVDTHVSKQSQLLGLTKQKNPDKIEQDLMKLYDQRDWFPLTYLLIEHGRNVRRKKSDRNICKDKMCILCQPKTVQ